MAFSNTKNSGITTQTTVYTPSGTSGTVIGMTIAPTATVATVDVQLGTTYLVKGLSIEAGTSAVPIGGGQKLVVTNGENLSVTSDVVVDVIVSYLE
jgi:hypothetical protein